MDSREVWWPYKIMCVILYGSHDSINYPIPGHVSIETAKLCQWLCMPTTRFRKYIKKCEEMEMIENLKITKGFVFFKVKVPELFNPNAGTDIA